MSDQFFTQPPTGEPVNLPKQDGPIPTNSPSVDPATGEILGTRNPGTSAMERYAPNLGNVRTAEEIAGKQVRFLNLQDNPGIFADKSGLITKVEYNPDGDLGEYVKLLFFPIDGAGKPEFPVVVMTGAQNVVDRALALKDFAKPESPILVTFRQAGRAWLMD